MSALELVSIHHQPSVNGFVPRKYHWDVAENPPTLGLRLQGQPCLLYTSDAADDEYNV